MLILGNSLFSGQKQAHPALSFDPPKQNPIGKESCLRPTVEDHDGRGGLGGLGVGGGGAGGLGRGPSFITASRLKIHPSQQVVEARVVTGRHQPGLEVPGSSRLTRCQKCTGRRTSSNQMTIDRNAQPGWPIFLGNLVVRNGRSNHGPLQNTPFLCDLDCL